MASVSSTHANHTANGAALQAETCPKCGVEASQSLRHCPTCGIDLGCPNVRAATTQAEANALSARFKIAYDKAEEHGLSTQFNALVAAVNSASHVVVAMPPLYARSFLTDPRMLYANYESLVGAESRTPAPFENDSERFSVSGKLFASYAPHIRYGVLSLDGIGLKTYGLVFLTLRDVAIEQRVSFLHENSYLFLDNLRLTVREEIPRGFRSSWQNRAELAAAKIEPMLNVGSSPSEWAGQLVVQGATRAEDSCIEAHIFGSFNVDSIQSVEFAGPGTSREEKNDIAIIKEFMTKRRSAGGTT